MNESSRRYRLLANWRHSVDTRDLVAGVGLVLMTIGLAMVHIATAFIVPGVVLFGLAVWRMR